MLTILTTLILNFVIVEKKHLDRSVHIHSIGDSIHHISGLDTR